VEGDPIAVLLKLGFLLVLYVFLVWVVWSASRDLRQRARGELAGESPSDGLRREARHQEFDMRAGVRPSLEVVAALGHEPGELLDLDSGATLGRSPGSDIRIDDPFASSAHARIFPRGQFMYIEDMGSTNGTYLNGRKLNTPQQLKVADTIRIGDTEYRYQE
jgi:hypothetical protein